MRNIKGIDSSRFFSNKVKYNNMLTGNYHGKENDRCKKKEVASSLFRAVHALCDVYFA